MGKHRAYGLTIVSALPFPELPPGQGAPDVVFRLGSVPERLQHADHTGVFYEANADQLLLRVRDIATYLIQNGDEIVIEPIRGASDDDVRLFLLGSCLGVLLQQRGLLALHASAVRTDRGAVLFAGPSGNGKSTLLAALLQRGYAMLADDVTAVTLDSRQLPVALPGYPQTKLWADSADRLAQPTGALRRLRPGYDKFAVAAHASFCDTPIELHRIYVLAAHDVGNQIFIETLSGSARFDALRRSSYGKRFLDGPTVPPQHFRLAAAVANHARFAQVTRPRAPFLLDELADRIEEDMAR